MGLAFIPLYIKYLGIEAYGLIGLFAVLQAWLTLLDMGMSPTLGREMARFTAGSHTAQSIGDLLRSLEIIVFSIACMIALIICGGSAWLSENWLSVAQLAPTDVARAISIVALVIGLRFCEGIYRSAIVGLQQQVWFNSARALLSTLQYAGVLPVLAFMSPTIEAFFLWQALVLLVAVATYAIKLHRLLPTAPSPPKFSRSALLGVWRFAGGMLGINFLAILLTQIDKVLLSRLLTLTEYGYYVLAATVAAGLYLMVGPITQAFYPRMVECHTQSEDESLALVYHQGAQLVTLATAPAMAVIFFFPEGVFYLWSGDIFLAERTAPLLALLILGAFLNSQMWMPYHCQLAHGWTSLGVKVNVAAVCLLVPAIFWLVPIYGAIAAACLWVALNAGYALIGIHFMHRRILQKEKRRWYISDVLLPTMGCVSLVFIVRTAFPFSIPKNRLSLGLFLALNVIVALVITLRLSDQIWPYIRARITKIC